jgi:hypothetical protein
MRIFLDCMLVAGWGLSVYGCWTVYQPAAFIWAGLTLMAYSLRASYALRSPNTVSKPRKSKRVDK